MEASIVDMTLRLPVDETLFEELRVHFLPRASQHPGFRGFQYVLGGQGHAIGILSYEQPTDLDGITELVGSWFRDHISPRRAEPESTLIRGQVVVDAGRGVGQCGDKILRHSIRLEWGIVVFKLIPCGWPPPWCIRLRGELLAEVLNSSRRCYTTALGASRYAKWPHCGSTARRAPGTWPPRRPYPLATDPNRQHAVMPRCARANHR